MEKDTQSRKWQLTINNPLEKGLTHSTIKEIMENFKTVEYWCMCDEVGLEENTPHTHIFFYSANGVLFSKVKKYFEKAHIEHCKGTCAQNRDYIRKEGKYKNDEKTKTNLTETFEEFGTMPTERQGARNDLADLLDMITAGLDTSTILEQYPNYMLQLDKIERTRQIMLESKYKNVFRNMEVQYIFGAPGSGKTRGVMEKFGFEKVYRVTDYKNPFDGYHGQDVIIFEEFRSSLKIGDMLNYLDGYPLSLPCRFSNKQACYTKVFIISNIPLTAQYNDLQSEQTATWKAFLRRINGGVVEYFANGNVNNYKTVEEYYSWQGMNGCKLIQEDLPF